MIIVVRALILCGIIIAAHTTLECISFFTINRDVITSFEGKKKIFLYASYCLYIAICLLFVVAMFFARDNIINGIVVVSLALILFLFTNWIFVVISNVKSKTKEIAESLIGMIEARDTNLDGHSIHVMEIAMLIYDYLPYKYKKTIQCENLRYAALFLDVGKLGIPSKVLNKPGKLTAEERQLIQNHTIAGGNMLKQLSSLKGVRETALYHHERYDGKGYPEGLKGNEIPLYARIVGVADSYDAMSSNRVYRRHLSKDEIIEEMQKGSGTQFDPDIVTYMVDMINDGYVNVVKMETAEDEGGDDKLHISEEDIPGLYMGL